MICRRRWSKSSKTSVQSAGLYPLAAHVAGAASVISGHIARMGSESGLLAAEHSAPFMAWYIVAQSLVLL